MAKLLAYTVTSNLDKEGIKNAVLKNLKTAEKTAGTDAFSLTFDNNTKKLYMIFSEQMVSKNPNMDEHMVEIKPDIETAALRSLLDGVYAGKTEIEQLRQAIAALDGVGDGGIIGDSSSGVSQVDLSNYYTKNQTDEKITEVCSALERTVAQKADKSELEKYATKEELAAIESAGDGGVIGEPTQKTYKKFVVVGVWGQSNAVGYDEGEVNAFDIPMHDNNRIMQISAVDNNLKPLTYCAENLQNMNTVIPQGYTGSNMPGQPKPQQGTKGIHLPLANLICDAIPNDYGVIIVPYAFGGQNLAYFQNDARVTGFTNNIKKVLDLNNANILAGIIWCQGESNANNTNGATYKSGFESLINSVATKLAGYENRTSAKKVDKNIWYFYEYPMHYRTGYTYGYEIMNAIKEVVTEKRYVSLREDHPVNITKYTSGNMAAHYAGDFYRTDVAPKVFMCMCNNGAFFKNYHDSNTVSGSSDNGEINTKISNLEKKNTLLEAQIEALKVALEGLGAEIPDDTPVPRTIEQSDIQKGVVKGTDFNPVVSNGTLTIQGSGGAGVNMLSADITHFEGTTNGKNFVFIVAGNDTMGAGMFAQAVSNNNFYYGKAQGDAGFSSKSITGYASASNLASQRFVMDIDGNIVTAKLGDHVIFEGDVSTGIGGDMTFTTPRLGFGVSWSGSIGNFVFTDCKVY